MGREGVVGASTSAELAHLHASIAVTPSEELAERILTESPERLSAWLELA